MIIHLGDLNKQSLQCFWFMKERLLLFFFKDLNRLQTITPIIKCHGGGQEQQNCDPKVVGPIPLWSQFSCRKCSFVVIRLLR